MNSIFGLSIEEVGNMTGTQIASLIRGHERINFRAKHNAEDGSKVKLPGVAYKKMKKEV